MKFKFETLEKEFWQLNPKLRMILTDTDYFCIKEFRKELFLTSLLRPKDKESVHACSRGADARSEEQDYFTKSEIYSLLQYVNSRYQYDFNRPQKKTVLHHETGQGWHLHFQVWIY